VIPSLILTDLAGIAPMTAPAGLIFAIRPMFAKKGPPWRRYTLIPDELLYILERSPDIEIEYYDDQLDKVFRFLNCRENSNMLLTAKDDTNQALDVDWHNIDWNGFHVCD
jgi:hypothetical protein